MEFFISTAGSVVDILVGKASESTVNQLGYLFKYKSKFQNLKEQVKELENARPRVQQSVKEAERNGKEIFDDVNEWLMEVNDKISEEAAAELEVHEEKAQTMCFLGLCPNIKSRYQLGKKADKEANSIAELLRKKSQLGGERVSYTPAPGGIGSRPVQGYQAFESRSAALVEVMEALQNYDINIIGVYGMGGVGKTTLVKEVAKEAKEKGMFEEDAMAIATVTQTFDTNKIQERLADAMGLKYEEQSDPGKAERLRQRLKKSKRVLIILDDIWERLDLEEIGIPSRVDHQGCKILITSRELHVLAKMDSQINVAIDTLNKDEALEMFKKMAGYVTEDPDIGPIAIQVAERCSGLPIAIKTIGSAMKNKEVCLNGEMLCES